MYFFDGLDQPRIGQRLGIKKAAVCRLIIRAQSALEVHGMPRLRKQRTWGRLGRACVDVTESL